MSSWDPNQPPAEPPWGEPGSGSPGSGPSGSGSGSYGTPGGAYGPPPAGPYGSPPAGPYGAAGLPQAPGYGPSYGASVPPGPPPENYLVWAIITTIMCCMPLGIAAIVFSTQVNTKWQAGDWAGAQDSSQKAKKFSMWSAIAGGILVVLLIVYYVVIIGIVASQGVDTSSF